MKPIVIVNFKAYDKGVGEAAIKLAETCKDFDAWIAVQAVDINKCAQTGCKVLAQHVDGITYGRGTGLVLPEAVKQAGATGTLLNHSERRLSEEELIKAISRCREIGLMTIVCVENVDEGVRIKQYKPDFIALEDPELISGDISITSAEPELVRKAVERIGGNTLMGAGVHSGEDLKASMDLGAKGVLLASAIVKKAEDPRKALEELYSTIT